MTAEKMCLGIPSYSVQVPYSRDSSTMVSPTSRKPGLDQFPLLSFWRSNHSSLSTTFTPCHAIRLRTAHNARLAVSGPRQDLSCLKRYELVGIAKRHVSSPQPANPRCVAGWQPRRARTSEVRVCVKDAADGYKRRSLLRLPPSIELSQPGDSRARPRRRMRAPRQLASQRYDPRTSIDRRCRPASV